MLDEKIKELERIHDELEATVHELTASLHRALDERNQLYWHCKALVELFAQLRTQPPVAYAAAYLTRVVPPPQEPKQ
jgi:chromosome condensin MukBEF ATPase and DNA-binding subunit MukB